MECPASGQAHLKARIIVDEQIEGDKRRLRTRLGETRVLVPALAAFGKQLAPTLSTPGRPGG
jgi:hypothetical protein